VVSGFAANLFRTHVWRGSSQNDTARRRIEAPGGLRRLIRSGLASACEAKVEDLDDARRRDLDVRRLEIAMDDPLLVRRLEGFGDLPRDVE
jgi:hypothetical protein